MWFSLVLVDSIAPDGTVDSFEVRAKQEGGSVVVDRLRDIHIDHLDERSTDIAGVRLYNSNRCSIEKRSSKLQDFSFTRNGCLKFTIHHHNIPLQSGHSGIYHLVLPPGWRLRSLMIRRDSSNMYWPKDRWQWDDSRRLKERSCKYRCIWDKSCSVQLIEMDMMQHEGSISYDVLGMMSLVTNDNKAICYVKAIERQDAVADITNVEFVDPEGRKSLSMSLAEKANWLELKPNILGVGINFNKVISDCIKYFQQKLRSGNTTRKG